MTGGLRRRLAAAPPVTRGRIQPPNHYSDTPQRSKETTILLHNRHKYVNNDILTQPHPILQTPGLHLHHQPQNITPSLMRFSANFIGMETSEAFRLLEEPHAVTRFYICIT